MKNGMIIEYLNFDVEFRASSAVGTNATWWYLIFFEKWIAFIRNINIVNKFDLMHILSTVLHIIKGNSSITISNSEG